MIVQITMLIAYRLIGLSHHASVSIQPGFWKDGRSTPGQFLKSKIPITKEWISSTNIDLNDLNIGLISIPGYSLNVKEWVSTFLKSYKTQDNMISTFEYEDHTVLFWVNNS